MPGPAKLGATAEETRVAVGLYVAFARPPSNGRAEPACAPGSARLRRHDFALPCAQFVATHPHRFAHAEGMPENSAERAKTAIPQCGRDG